MGLFALAFTGGSFFLIGAWESLSLTSKPPPSSSSSQPISKTHRFSTITLISTLFLSLLFISYAFSSLFDAFTSKDKLGSSLQLQVFAISSLFLMFSFLGLVSNFSKSISFPYCFINLILLFAFVEEFLFFYLHVKDPNGIENRYFSLMLVPVLVCVVSTMVELKCPESNVARLGRGMGLILQGTWFVQMGFSFYSNLIAHNCTLYEKSRGNYTIKCKDHMDTHRGGAIAVLLFNCHLAMLVSLVFGVYAVFGRKFVDVGDYRSYKPLGGEVRGVVNQSQFSLDSDSDDGGVDEIKPEKGGEGEGSRENGVVELVVNGFGSHQ